MCKASVVLSLLSVAVLITESSCQGFRIIRPTYRPPLRGPVIIRTFREAPDQEPLWLNQGDIPRAPASEDHPLLPKNIDDISLDPNSRYARSLDSPSARHCGGLHTVRIHTGSDRHTGPTYPGYNRRQAREIRLPFEPLPRPRNPFDPFPRPGLPGPRPRFPMYV